MGDLYKPYQMIKSGLRYANERFSYKKEDLAKQLLENLWAC